MCIVLCPALTAYVSKGQLYAVTDNTLTTLTRYTTTKPIGNSLSCSLNVLNSDAFSHTVNC